ncbi:MAG: 2-hydroxyacid dehydrogenase [Clostridia bacterium]|nr:2-hydroxyacid dehydrogenase [Clostridia bacterium]
MKLVGIGDLFIPCEYIENGIKNIENVEVHTVEWKLKGFDELQNINLLVEQGGREDFEAPDYLMEAISDADIIITQFCPITKKIIDACKNLKYIGVLRAGYENVNVAYAKEKGIKVFNTPGRNAHAVSDFTVGMIICEARNIARGHHGIKNGEWIRDYSNSGMIPDLGERTVGLIGYGEIGRLVAKKLSGFDMNVLVYDPFYKGDDVNLVSLEELMKNSDFVSLHARLTEENKHMIGAKELSLMKKTAYLINTSRSALVDEKALYDALKSKSIAGAAIDVFDVEPPSKDYPLVTLDNVTLTPHMAGGSNDAFINTPKRLIGDMKKAFAGNEKECKFLIK